MVAPGSRPYGRGMPPARRLPRRRRRIDARAPLGAVVLALLVGAAVALPVAAVDPEASIAPEVVDRRLAVGLGFASASARAGIGIALLVASPARPPARPPPRARPRRRPRHRRPHPRHRRRPRRRRTDLARRWAGRRPRRRSARARRSTAAAGATASGLSQYGAKGRAHAGQTAEQILAAYYKGVDAGAPSARPRTSASCSSPATTPSSPPRSSSTGARREWKVDGIARTFPAGGVLKLYRSTSTVDGVATTTWRLRAYAADGTTLLHSAVVSGSVVVRPTSIWTRLQLDSRPSSYDTYRGLLKVKLGPSSATVINHVELDLYLRGVVPVEMSPDWPAEALRAQTAAARSLRRTAAPPGRGQLRRLRRHAVAGLPRRRGRAERPRARSSAASRAR